jgi:Zn-dependent alcohol dehydrogenase
VIGLVRSGRFPVERLVSKRVRLEADVQDGFLPLTRGDTAALKILVEL